MYTYQLASLFVNCPQEWKNFIYYLRTEYGRPIEAERVESAIKEYHGIKYKSIWTDDPCVIFETEEDALAFKLKWM